MFVLQCQVSQVSWFVHLLLASRRPGADEQTSLLTLIAPLLISVCLFYNTTVFCASTGVSPQLLLFLSVHSSFSEGMGEYDHFVLLFMAASFLSSVFLLCALIYLSISLSLLDAGHCSPPSPSFLPHPLSLLFCSLCARSVLKALTSRCDPTELR